MLEFSKINSEKGGARAGIYNQLEPDKDVQAPQHFMTFKQKYGIGNIVARVAEPGFDSSPSQAFVLSRSTVGSGFVCIKKFERISFYFSNILLELFRK
jgi:hypothetical protein